MTPDDPPRPAGPAAKAWVDALTVLVTHALKFDPGRKPLVCGEDD